MATIFKGLQGRTLVYKLTEYLNQKVMTTDQTGGMVTPYKGLFTDTLLRED